MKRIKRIISTFACALAVLIWTCIPAQAGFYGTLQRDQPYQIEIDNTSNASGDTAAVTVFYLSERRVVDFEIITIPGGELVGLEFSIAKGTRRIIIELDASPGLPTTRGVPLKVIQGLGTTFNDSGIGGARMVINVQ
jgi:hypothetical protein